ncbi:LacI family DNA-binding transcriptional regulator [Novosphingobium sp. ZN18A2]|uniref:LacI family DNA-binding transcriptional regulator n=1 Tax=Novosphingobium sp. ZN18A2 TaxID=3079861 RepID=UPI0030D00B66
MPGRDDIGGQTRARRPRRVTSFDVAEAAGVSQSTVSRALAHDPSISQRTRERVIAAAQQLNYQVDENAARLRKGRTGTLAVVMICRAGQDRNDINPFYFSLLGSTCAAASTRGYEVLVSFQDSPENFWGHHEERRRADGLIVIGTCENAAAWDYFGALSDRGLHWVCWGSPDDAFDWVRSDNRTGAALAAELLVDRGCRDIYCLGKLGSSQRQFDERWDGFSEAMRGRGHAPRLAEVEPGLSREEQGRRAVAALVDAGTPFDGIFAVCDEMALGALKELEARGMAVPDDVAIVGFDGARAGAFSSPPLTTIEPDFEVAGALLVDRLLAQLGELDTPGNRVPVRMLRRGTA